MFFFIFFRWRVGENSACSARCNRCRCNRYSSRRSRDWCSIGVIIMVEIRVFENMFIYCKMYDICLFRDRVFENMFKYCKMYDICMFCIICIFCIYCCLNYMFLFYIKFMLGFIRGINYWLFLFLFSGL